MVEFSFLVVNNVAFGKGIIKDEIYDIYKL
jgi:hypothetical protein